MSLFCNCFGGTKPKKLKKKTSDDDAQIKLTAEHKEILKYSSFSSNKKSQVIASPFPRKKSELIQKEGLDSIKLDDSVLNNKKNSNSTSIKRSDTKGRMSILGEFSPTKEKKVKPLHWKNKDTFVCLFCGGDSCKHENYLKNNVNNAIVGLHSNFITSDIIASQRPSTILVNKHNLVRAFNENNIGLIVNLQREGEHPYCGPNKKLEDSGFSYLPSQFLVENIKCKLSGWKDMSVPQTVTFMVDIVKEMCCMIKEEGKKVLVHCHAGYGRTGVVIACYLIYTTYDSVEVIVNRIRNKRKGCIQKKEQYEFCEKFSDYIRKARIFFDKANSYTNSPQKLPIEHFLNHQKDILFGNRAKQLEYVPFIIYTLLEKLLDIKKTHNIENNTFYINLLHTHEWNDDCEVVLNFLKKSINKGDYQSLRDADNILIVSQILYDWLEDDVQYVIDPDKLIQLQQMNNFTEDLDSILENPNLNFKLMQDKAMSIFEITSKEISRLIEFETIVKVAQFFYCIFPDKQEDYDNYVHTIDRFSLNLMGYKYSEELEKNHEDVTEPVLGLAMLLSNIIRYYVYAMRHEIYTNSTFTITPHYSRNFAQSDSLIPSGSKWSKSNTIMSMKPKLSMLSASGFPDFENIMGSKNKYFPSDLDFKDFNEIKFMNSEKQEQFFFNLYGKLNDYFNPAVISSKKAYRKSSVLSDMSDLAIIHQQLSNIPGKRASNLIFNNGNTSEEDIKKTYGEIHPDEKKKKSRRLSKFPSVPESEEDKADSARRMSKRATVKTIRSTLISKKASLKVIDHELFQETFNKMDAINHSPADMIKKYDFVGTRKKSNKSGSGKEMILLKPKDFSKTVTFGNKLSKGHIEHDIASNGLDNKFNLHPNEILSNSSVEGKDFSQSNSIHKVMKDENGIELNSIV